MADAGVSLPDYIPQPHKEHRQYPRCLQWLEDPQQASLPAIVPRALQRLA
jgi:hypothetical protein